MNALDYSGPAWSPYWVGAGIGVLSWLTFYVSNKPIGASSFYAHIAGFIGRGFAPLRTKSLTYFKDKPPAVGWGFAFVLATVAGGAIAALTGGEFVNEVLPPMWKARFGDSIALRAAIGFSGGVLMALGARLAGGCTSGHGISGTLQLNPGSWITAICLFLGGIAVAIPLFAL
ncbi:MAG: YeeE/YedE thiosulfate transporter family protein [Kiritimatiellia bacterium]